MPNLNKVMLIGNLTRDPELRYIPSGAAVCEFGLAINRKWKGKDGGAAQEETCFVDCVAWARAAEVIAEYCHKGDPLYVEGRLQLDTWEARDGAKRSKLRVVIENFQLLGGRKGGDAGEPRPAPARAEPAKRAPADTRGGFAPMDDDIPF